MLMRMMGAYLLHAQRGKPTVKKGIREVVCLFFCVCKNENFELLWMNERGEKYTPTTFEHAIERLPVQISGGNPNPQPPDNASGTVPIQLLGWLFSPPFSWYAIVSYTWGLCPGGFTCFLGHTFATFSLAWHFKNLNFHTKRESSYFSYAFVGVFGCALSFLWAFNKPLISD